MKEKQKTSSVHKDEVKNIATSSKQEKDQGHPNKRELFFGGSLILLFLAVVVVILVVLYPMFGIQNTSTSSNQNISAEEKRLDENITEIESIISELDPNVDLVEFEDDEFTTSTAENELDSLVEDIEEVFNNLNDLESEFADYEEADF